MSIERFNRLMELATGYWPAAALNAAVQVGLFEALEAQPGATSQQIASVAKLSANHAAALLDALAGMGLVEKVGSGKSEVGSAEAEHGYRIAEEYREYLSPRGKMCALEALRFNADLYSMWGRLSDCTRNGQSAVPGAPGSGHLGGDPQRTRRFVMGMHSRALGLAEAIVPAINLASCRNLLDVGAGPGTFSRMLIEQFPGLRVTLFDLTGVLDVARELGEAHALKAWASGDRVTFAPGNYRTDELPKGHDAILYCGAVHQETPEGAMALFVKMFAALEPGGRVFVVDLMLDDDRTMPTFAALFSIQMKLLNPAAGAFAVADVRRLLADAGFVNVTDHRLGPTAYHLVEARKP